MQRRITMGGLSGTLACQSASTGVYSESQVSFGNSIGLPSCSSHGLCKQNHYI
ncbi:hypothetical protein B484DRAFT_454464, partial [Ochromonadaceae sp. CCMP2298]